MVNDDVLVAAIERSRHRLAYIAPGISDQGFRSALEAAFQRSGQGSAYTRLFEEYDAAREAE